MTVYQKKYVGVILSVDEFGKNTPIAVVYEGRQFGVDKIIDEKLALPEHVGGIVAKKFEILVRGKRKNLYFDTHNKRWFVEKPQYV